MTKGSHFNQDATLEAKDGELERATYKTQDQIFGGVAQRAARAEQDCEVSGVTDGAKTKPDLHVSQIMRNYLESVARNDKGSGIPRLWNLMEELYNVALHSKGYAKIEAIKILLDRAYGKPVEHVQVRGGGAITGLTINVHGVKANPDNNKPIPIVKIQETKKPKQAEIEQD